jgi:hypothetical protein
VRWTERCNKLQEIAVKITVSRKITNDRCKKIQLVGKLPIIAVKNYSKSEIYQ